MDPCIAWPKGRDEQRALMATYDGEHTKILRGTKACISFVLFVSLMLSIQACTKALSERVVGTWLFYDAGVQRGDGLSLTLEEGGKGTLSGGDDLTWMQFPNMQYVTITFADGSGNMTMRLKTEDSGTLRIAGALQELRRKGSSKVPE